jgi:hypothetical protein
MKKLLTLALLLPATLVVAEYQFDVDHASLDNLDCWNAETCSPISAVAYARNPADPSETFTSSQVGITGPEGFPLAYQFVVQADEGAESFPNASVIDSITVEFDGPGFEYSWTRDMTGETPGEWVFYLWGVSPPPDAADVMEVADGCVVTEYGLDWNFDTYPDGVVELLSDGFVVNAGETLTIAAGMTVYCLEDATLTIDGSLQANGTVDNWIDFVGAGWNGINFGAGTSSELLGTRIMDVLDDANGGALYMADGSLVTLRECILTNNETTLMGGAAYLETAATLNMIGCTVAYNTAGDGAGNIHLATPTSTTAGTYNLVSFATPENSEVLGEGVLAFTISSVYPQSDNYPNNWELNFYSNPGYADPANLDFTPSFWDVDEFAAGNYVKNIIIDPLNIVNDLDPDGTLRDMGAMYFDQHNILQPATLVAINDVPNDQGGMVLVEFDASLNDGNELNPVTVYSLWIAHPGMEEGEWISCGAVPAVGEQMTYMAQVNTQNDQYEGFENVHTFMVGTHSNNFDTPPVASVAMDGFSLDNLAPALVSGFAEGEWNYDQWPPTEDQMTVTWNASNANDLGAYRLYAGLDENYDNATLVYEGLDTDYTYTSPFGDLAEGDAVYFWIDALDVHMNVSALNDATAVYVSVEDRLPANFELAQNYPNPFNPTTTIAYALADAGQVNLTVFNLLGAPVATLVDGEQTAGRYEASFDAGRLASGVYFYRLETASFTDLKKMVLVK